jgi:aspartate 1-decarboxylase
MLIEVLRSKINRFNEADSKSHYIGCISLDKHLIDSANLVVGEKNQIVNNNNDERLGTYVIEGKYGSAARKVKMEI